MRVCFLRFLCASCAACLLALPATLRAQESGATPPWGRSLVEPAPLVPSELREEAGDTSHPVATEAEAARPLLFWVQADYLLWFTKNSRVPTLLTQGQTTSATPGALGAAGTNVLYSGDVDFKDRSGARFTAGVPFGPDNAFGVEATYMFLTARSVGTTLTSPGDPVLARPFFNVANNAEDSSLVTYPGVINGTVNIRSASFFQSAEANFTTAVWQENKNRVTLLAGFRYLNLREDLNITETTTGDANALQFAGVNINVADQFSTDNDFYGAQLGLRSELHFGRFEVDLLGKVALGDAHEVSQVAGRTVANTAIPINAAAGLLALSSNSGTFTRNAFAVVPEVGINVGFKVTERLSLFAGYSFIYWSDVARPGDQIDRNLNPNLIPTSNTFGMPGGPARPAPGIHSTDFYAHGLNVGATFRY
jgi:Putative beta barrel porin-7 (BBP7)